MADAVIELAGGGQVRISGTPEEVARVIALVGRPAEASVTPTSVHVRQGRRPSASLEGKKGPRAYILQLKADGFFDGSKRSIGAVREALEARGHIYPVTTLSGSLLDLVKKGELGRIKDEGAWLYVLR